MLLTNSFISQINRKNPLGKEGRIVSAYAELIKEIW